MRPDAGNPNAMTTGLAKLHYDPKWLEYGLIDLPFVNEQVKRYESGDDDNIEHYRYAAFRKLLEGAGSIDDLTLDRYVELAELDEDQEMAEAALGLLLRHNGLTEQQLNRIKTRQIFATRPLQNIIEQVQLLHELDSPTVTDAVFDRCVSIGKSEVQRKLLSKSKISPEQLAVLTDKGANRAIRNLARNQLRRHR